MEKYDKIVNEFYKVRILLGQIRARKEYLKPFKLDPRVQVELQDLKFSEKELERKWNEHKWKVDRGY